MRFFLFLPIVVLAYGAFQWAGLPHPIWSYEFEARDSHPLSERTYHLGTFIGPYVRWTEAAENGRCAGSAGVVDQLTESSIDKNFGGLP